MNEGKEERLDGEIPDADQGLENRENGQGDNADRWKTKRRSDRTR